MVETVLDAEETVLAKLPRPKAKKIREDIDGFFVVR